jgi:hypothetical protein
MSDGKHCPACGKDIGVWPVLLAVLPTRVRCSHCRARLTYGKSLMLLLGVTTAVALLVVASCYIVSLYLGTKLLYNNPAKFFGVATALFLALWIPVEAAFALYVRNRGVLKKLD